jgi:septum formation protein
VLLLASSSPQRRAILEQLGLAFEVRVPAVEELPAGRPEEMVVANALRKARAVSPMDEALDRWVLGVDTAVADDERVYGKPADEGEARAFLTALAGREHRVASGIAVLAPGSRPGATRARTGASVTRVRFRPLDEQEIDAYLASGEWRGRAGGYAIQGRGAALVERIEGDYTGVVGLPVAELVRLAPELFRRGGAPSEGRSGATGSDPGV